MTTIFDRQSRELRDNTM